MRVISLVPSATETLLAWGVEPVACTRFCEQPSIRHVGGTKDPRIDDIVELAPDLVVVDEEENRREDADALVAAGIVVHALAIRGVTDVGPQLRALADAVGADPGELRTWEPPPIGPPDVTAFVPIWKRPWMGLGPDTYGHDVLARIGLANALADAGTRYPEVDLDAVRADVVLAPSEPYPFAERHVPLLEHIAPVVLVDGKDLFWWGARTPAALDRLTTRLRDADRRAG